MMNIIIVTSGRCAKPKDVRCMRMELVGGHGSTVKLLKLMQICGRNHLLQSFTTFDSGPIEDGMLLLHRVSQQLLVERYNNFLDHH
jgi:hypothetical protein